MRCLTAGLLVAVVTAMFASRYAGEYGAQLSATANWYRLRTESRVLVALVALVTLIAVFVYASSYRPPPQRVYTQTIRAQDYARTGKEFTRQQLEKLRSAPEYQHKMAELRQARSAFDEDGPEATSEWLSSEM